MKNFLTIIMILAVIPQALADHYDLQKAILYLSGASSMEELSEESIEHYEALASHPLEINIISSSRLVNSGLMSLYQVASLKDYISRSGPVLSIGELSLVDGFGAEYAQALAPFISFRFYDSLKPSSRVRFNLSTRAWTSLKASTNSASSATSSLKLSAGLEDRFQVSMALRHTYGNGLSLEALKSASLTFYGRRNLRQLIIGDSNARFGQGLAVWNGFSMTGFSTAKSFSRNPTGISASNTFSPTSTNRAVAAEWVFAPIVINTLAGYDNGGLRLLSNASYLFHSGQVGLSLDSQKVISADCRWNFGRIDFYSESALGNTGSLSALAGFTFNPEYEVRLSALFRYYAEDPGLPGGSPVRTYSKLGDECGISIAMDWKKMVASLDYAHRPSKDTDHLKALLRWKPESGAWHFDNKLSARFRPQDKLRLKTDAMFAVTADLRESSYLKLSASLCAYEKLSAAIYTEAGFNVNEAFKCSLRATCYDAESWNDRIYIYERDVPGSFTVPALYGRGASLSMVSSLKTGRLSASMRASATTCSRKEKKSGSAELKFYLSYKW